MKKLLALALLLPALADAATISVWTPGGDLANSTTATNQQLSTTGATAGAFVLPNLTIDAKGRITASSSSTSASVIGKWTGTCNSSTFLRADGSCQTPAAGSPGGSDTQVQYNGTGAFAGSANFTWTDGSSLLTINGTQTVNSIGVGTSAGSTGRVIVNNGVFGSSDAGQNLGSAGTRWNNLFLATLDSGFGTSIAISGNGSGVGALRTDTANTLVFQPGTGGYIWRDSGNANTRMSLTDAGVLTANGSGLTALNATQLTTGTVPDGRFPATLPAASGVNLTALNATQLTSGTVPDARFPATLPAASGANLTALNATQLTSGTVPDARLSGTYSNALTLSSASNSFTGNTAAFTSATVGGSAVCRLDGVNCPAGSVTETSGTFTATFTNACTTSPTVSFDWVKVGSVVTIWGVAESGFTCTGDSVSFETAAGDAPATIRPAVDKFLLLASNAVDSGSNVGVCLQMVSDGTVRFNVYTVTGGCAGGSASWTASGNRDVNVGNAPTTYSVSNP